MTKIDSMNVSVGIDIAFKGRSLGEVAVDVYQADDPRGRRCRWAGLVRAQVLEVVGLHPQRDVGSLLDEPVHPEAVFHQITVGGITYPVHGEPAPEGTLFHVTLSRHWAKRLLDAAQVLERKTSK